MNTLANLIAITCVLHFCWSYYSNCIRKGFTIDIWHYNLVFNLFIIHIMLPFSRSDLNALALGPSLLRRMQAHINQAYFISAFGYIGIIAGGALWRVHLGAGLRGVFSRLIELPAEASLFLLNSKRLLLAHGLAALSLLIGLLLYYFSVAGFGLNFGSLIITSPVLRPIAQFATFYSILIGSYCLARFARYKEVSMIGCTVGIGMGLFFFGSRSALVGIILPPALVLFVIMKRRLKLGVLLSSVVLALCASALLDALRRPGFSLSSVATGFAVQTFYGNSFSDTRDFAVILGFWDGHYFFGKTYLAGILAFVPRFLSSFRDTWALGVVTATLAGFKTTEHAGLRIGVFGEAFLNFGLGAVLLMGLFLGASTRLIDQRIKQSAATLPASGMRVYSYFLIFTVLSAVENTGNASTVYSIAVILLISWALVKVSRAIRLTLF